MTRYSLRLRLLVGAAVAVFAALALAWLAMTLLFQRHLELRVEQELRRDALQLVAGLSVNPAGMITIQQLPTDPRFGDSGGRPLLAGQHRRSSRNARAPSGTRRLRRRRSADALEWRTRQIDGPFGQRLFLLERIVQPVGSMERVLVQLALDENELTRCPRRIQPDAGAVPAAAVGGACGRRLDPGSARASAAQTVAARTVGAAPQRGGTVERRLSARSRAADQGDQRSCHRARGRREARAPARRRSRARHEDAARRARGAEPPDPRRTQRSCAPPPMGSTARSRRRRAAVEAELARARAAASRHARQDAQAAPLAVAQRLILVLERTEKGMRLDYVLDMPETLRLAVAAEDLSEILGPLLENAVRFARRQVRVSGAATDGSIALSVEDDGPGLSAAEAAEVMVRGVRLDQTGGGHGLGSRDRARARRGHRRHDRARYVIARRLAHRAALEQRRSPCGEPKTTSALWTLQA